MRRRRDEEDEDAGTGSSSAAGESLRSDTVNEQVLVAAALADDAARDHLLRKLRPEHFFQEDHRAAWTCFAEMARRGLSFDLATVQRAGSGRVDVGYLKQLLAARPDAPDNLGFHLDAALWDYSRITALKGPVSALIEAARDPRAEPARVRALARSVAASFEGVKSGHLRDARGLVTEALTELDDQLAGRSTFPYGIEGLDYHLDEDPPRRRIIPGASPGQITVLTATSGSGKSTIAAHMALGLARQRRRVLYAAWEPQSTMTLKLMAGISLGWSRKDLVVPDDAPEGAAVRTPEGRRELEERMHKIGRFVRFMDNPFRRLRGTKRSNERNLDVVQEAIVDAAADVFIADLWERCLHDSEPNSEKEALFRQQAMALETRSHHILLAQQRSKDIEQRPDKRPTREGVRGSSAWLDIADTKIGVHLPHLWKNVPEDKIELIVLKQRWGKWPIAVEFDWDGDRGVLEGGRSIRYEHAGDMNEMNIIDQMVNDRSRGGRGKRR